MRKIVHMLLTTATCLCYLHGQSVLTSREQLQQYVMQLQANSTDDSLRTKIIQLALQLQPPPAIPPEADELAGRAQYIFEHANAPDDLVKAADAFEKVALVAPWLPDYYFDAAVAYEKANRPADALKDYKLSILAYPQDSPDAKKVREKIGALSYVLEQQQEQERQAEARRETAAQAEQQRELHEEQARKMREDWQQEYERQRLANLDPLIKQLDGATYQQKFPLVLATWIIRADKIVVTKVSPAATTTDTFPIEGRSFHDTWNSIGTISEKAITFQLAGEDPMNCGGCDMTARRVRSRR